MAGMGRPSSDAPRDALVGSGPPATPHLPGAGLGPEGAVTTGDGQTGPPRRRGSYVFRRLGAVAGELASQPRPRREPWMAAAAQPAVGAGKTALPGLPGIPGRARGQVGGGAGYGRGFQGN
uniref:Uncharacterized protein n=1 Tax=Sphaerodactylus townsendi TaxID=933632 RepID=A0ACB8G3W5_9SAUR